MFTNCPFCGYLVALDAKGQPLLRCPNCAQRLRDDPAADPAPAVRAPPEAAVAPAPKADAAAATAVPAPTSAERPRAAVSAGEPGVAPDTAGSRFEAEPVAPRTSAPTARSDDSPDPGANAAVAAPARPAGEPPAAASVSPAPTEAAAPPHVPGAAAASAATPAASAASRIAPHSQPSPPAPESPAATDWVAAGQAETAAQSPSVETVPKQAVRTDDALSGEIERDAAPADAVPATRTAYLDDSDTERGSDMASAPVATPEPADAAPPKRRRTADALPSFARPARPRIAISRRRRALEIGAVAGLTLLLALQLLLAERGALADDARWRPALSALCDTLRCALPPWREPAAFHVLQRDVRAQAPGVLRVSAQIRNDARWSQPWSTLRLTLSDAHGRAVAVRDFLPREYLGGAPAQAQLASGQSAALAMDIIEPGRQAVAFTFDFH